MRQQERAAEQTRGQQQEQVRPRQVQVQEELGWEQQQVLVDIPSAL